MDLTVELKKWPARPHYRLPLHRLAADELGQWLWAPAGADFQRPDGSVAQHACDFLMLVPRSGSWLAEWLGGHPEMEVYVHVTDTPRWAGDGVIAVDLDLDVVRGIDGSVRVLDEDEFEQNRALYGYPPHLVAAATAEAARLRSRLEGRLEPFGEAGRLRLSELPTRR